jgi:hypothetical protein
VLREKERGARRPSVTPEAENAVLCNKINGQRSRELSFHTQKQKKIREATEEKERERKRYVDG